MMQYTALFGLMILPTVLYAYYKRTVVKQKLTGVSISCLAKVSRYFHQTDKTTIEQHPTIPDTYVITTPSGSVRVKTLGSTLRAIHALLDEENDIIWIDVDNHTAPHNFLPRGPMPFISDIVESEAVSIIPLTNVVPSKIVDESNEPDHLDQIIFEDASYQYIIHTNRAPPLPNQE